MRGEGYILLPLFLNIKMKFKYITILILVLTVFISCGKKKESKKEYIRPASMYYSKQDTIDINSLVDQYLVYFKEKNLEAAADMLYFVRHDSILPLDEARRQRFMNLYKLFPVYDAKQKSFILNSDRNNMVRVVFQVSKDGDMDNEQGTMHFTLNPVVKDGKWYLTLFDPDAEGVEDVYKAR